MHSRPEARSPSVGWTAYECQASKVIVLAHDNKIAISRMRPNRRIAGAAHAEEFYVRATGPVRGEFSHKPRNQVLIEEQFHAMV
jgi:hypothetical protein